jgi:hypothetical protein
MTRSLTILLLIASFFQYGAAFVHPSMRNGVSTFAKSESSLGVFGKKKEPVEDLSFIESRDMTREEMIELNQKNEDIMNMELQMMTGFSLVISLPILYLCWVAFFSE